MKRLFICLFVLCCLANVPAHAARKALLLGNTNYTSVKRLSGPTADVDDMEKALQALGFEPKNILKKSNLNLQQTQDAAREFRALIQEGDEVLIYYSGHAVQLGGGNYLLPTDTPNREQIDSEQAISDRAVRLQRFLSDASERKARFTLMIVDACRDNPIQITNGKSIHTGQGLAPETPSNGQMIVFAAGANQVAKDKLYDSDRNSLFTGVLLQKMRTPGLEIRDLFAQVKEEVYTQARKVRHEQLPSLYDQSLGKFYFAGVQSGPTTLDAKEADINRLQREKDQLVKELALAHQRLAAPTPESVTTARTKSADSPKTDAEALRLYRQNAEAGDPQGMNKLGGMYLKGRGIEQSDTEALRWYRKAAEAGNSDGMTNLGWMYREGRGVAQSDTEATRWYRKAAEAGNSDGMTNLGWMYREGRGVAQSDTEALRWYRKAAEAGEPYGMNNLGLMYREGKGGITQDDTEATRWFRKAADAGNPESMNNLGWMYQMGRGVAQSDTEALRWYHKAAEAGEPHGMRNLGLMYREGKGVPKNESEANRWFDLAKRAAP